MYHWVQALHVIAAISWMAGLLYLPRLFVYHCEAAKGSELSETLKVMERRLLKAIMTPAMLVTWGAGLGMLFWPGIENWAQPWMWIKFAFVLILTVAHGGMGKWRKQFAIDANVRPQRFYRIANEVPTAAMIVIVIMVIVKPF